MPLFSPTSSNGGESYPLRSLKSIAKVHPKRMTKSAAPQALSSHILGLDLGSFRLTKEDIESIKLCSKKRFEKDGRVITKREQRLRELEIVRRKILVNWVSDRHMTSAFVVRGKTIIWPGLEGPNMQGGGYFGWVGDILLYLSQRFIPAYTSPWEDLPKYNRKKALSQIERIAIGAAPFQEWVMKTRSVYRWEDPVRTGRWLFTYFVLWRWGHLITFLYVYLISRVLRNRQDLRRVERVKKAIYRLRDQQQDFHRISELIERHGSDEWVEALPDSFGPWAQMKLGDTADVLEVIRNFYEWRNPKQTIYTLIFFGVCLLMGLLTSLEYCWKIITFVFGLWFFISSPIASRWPKYRWVVSPFKWIFWGVPTHADIAYAEYRLDAENALNDPTTKKKSAKRRAKRRKVTDYEGPVMVIDDDEEDEGYVTNSPEMEEDEQENDPEELISGYTTYIPESMKGRFSNAIIFCGFKCIRDGNPGKIFVSDYGLIFETELQKKLTMEVKWADIRSIRKKDSLSTGKIGEVHGLVVELVNGEEVVLEAVGRRNKAFNRIIGFSGLQWQSGL